MKKSSNTFLLHIFFLSSLLFISGCKNSEENDIRNEKAGKKNTEATSKIEIVKLKIDTVDYNKRMLVLSNNDTTGKWPVKAPYPLPGAILPYNRIIAFYGNIYSKRMGILGEIPKEEMLKKLKGEVAKWQAADSAVNEPIFVPGTSPFFNENSGSIPK